MSISEQAVLEALSRVRFPGFTRDVLSLEVVREVRIEDDRILLELHLERPEPGLAKRLEESIRAALGGIENVSAVVIRQTAAAGGGAPSLNVVGSKPTAAAGGALDSDLIPEVRHTIAVASGKGGVGKSTVAVNLAIALANGGLRVGLLDVDIYGPSIPIMMGAREAKPEIDPAERRLVPIERFGVRFMSLGFLVDPDSAVIWRGPMVMKAVDQLLREVAWGALDVLLLDMPPGTGDAQLTVSQRVSLAGAVIVTTPQDVALADAIKGVAMFRKVDVPILGIVENMSYYECPECSHRAEIFSHGGGRAQAERLGVPFLGEIPLDPAVRSSGDAGNPVTAAAPDSGPARAFGAIAAQVGQAVSGASDEASGSIFDRFRQAWRGSDD